MGFGESAKKWVAEALFFFVTCMTHHSCHFPWIDFHQTFHKHVSRWWLATHGFIFQKGFHQEVEFPENPSFYGTLFVLSLRVTGNVLRRLHSFYPLVDISQIYLSWVTFAEGCTVFHLSTSESDPLPQYQQLAYLDRDTVAPPGERRDTTQ